MGNSLPPQLRAIVRLRCFSQLTFAEIGDALNLPETTVKTSFYRSLQRLRRALSCNVSCPSTSWTTSFLSLFPVSQRCSLPVPRSVAHTYHF